MLKSVMRYLVIVLFCLSVTPAWSQSLIRDSELEHSLQKISEPLLQAAGLEYSGINILIVSSNSMNAFVLADDIYIHSGLIQRLRRVEQLQAVIAHEIGHITGGHYSQRFTKFNQSSGIAGLGLALGIAIAAASGEAGAGAGVAAGLADATTKDLLSYTRAQEAAADQTGALILAASGINPVAALEVLEYFRGQEAISSVRVDRYARTHPLSADRIRYLEQAADRYSGLPIAPQSDARYWFERAQAKLDGFRNDPKTVLRRTEASDTGEIATIRRAIAYFKLADISRARSQMDKLIAFKPEDPFYFDLYGQILLESGFPGEAVGQYRKALSYLPYDAQIIAGLGRAQLALNTAQGNKDALSSLKTAYARDARNGRMLRDLSTAYAKNGEPGMASLTTAERFALRGNLQQAAIHAKRALEQLPEGSVGALRAQDILAVASQRQ